MPQLKFKVRTSIIQKVHQNTLSCYKCYINTRYTPYFLFLNVDVTSGSNFWIVTCEITNLLLPAHWNIIFLVVSAHFSSYFIFFGHNYAEIIY